jgi:uncharacterized membrane protein YeaQ/YmgE (transglycosylase-associated protein family)
VSAALAGEAAQRRGGFGGSALYGGGRALGIVSWVVFGLVAGVVAKLLMPGRDPGGCIITMLLGVAGAFVGGFLYRLLTGREVFFRFDLGSFAVAVVGAVVILAIYRLVAARRA